MHPVRLVGMLIRVNFDSILLLFTARESALEDFAPASPSAPRLGWLQWCPSPSPSPHAGVMNSSDGSSCRLEGGEGRRSHIA